jgi:hypothetical protein
VLGEQVLVDARVVVVAVEKSLARERHEVLIPLEVAREHGEVAVLFLRVPAVGVLALGQVHLAADDGLKSHLRALVVELHGAEHVAVVGQAEALGAVAGQVLQQLGGLAVAAGKSHHPVEEGVLGVVVEVDEFGLHV